MNNDYILGYKINERISYGRAPDKLRFCMITQIRLTKTQFFYFFCVVEPNSIQI